MSSRILTVDPSDAGKSLIDWLCARLRVSRDQANRLLQERKVRIGGTPCSNPRWKLRAGQRIEVPIRRERPRSARSHLLAEGRSEPSASTMEPILHHVDEDIIVVDKPAGLTTMRHPEETAEFGARARRYLPVTLADLLPNLVARHERSPARPVIAVHRLDKETSGLVVFARNARAEQHLGQQFRAHSTERQYLAIVRGQAQSGRIESWLVRDRGDGRRGSSRAPHQGQHAVTHVSLLEALGDFSLVECRLETGRTHQVRIHLGEAGTPLCGERVYDRPLGGRPAADHSGIARVALHAVTLALDHPTTAERCQWTAPLSPDMTRLLERLRKAVAQEG